MMKRAKLIITILFTFFLTIHVGAKPNDVPMAIKNLSYHAIGEFYVQHLTDNALKVSFTALGTGILRDIGPVESDLDGKKVTIMQDITLSGARGDDVWLITGKTKGKVQFNTGNRVVRINFVSGVDGESKDDQHADEIYHIS